VVNGCATGHEHGDSPPSWIAAAGYQVLFDGPFHTGGGKENVTKHPAMKGFATRLNGVDLYFRLHAASNVLDRSARYHSYEVFAKDGKGGVSHWQGWYDSGDPAPYVGRIPRSQNTDVRPVILTVDKAAWDAGVRTEQWYMDTAPWSWTFGWNIGRSTTYWYAGENDQQAMSYWRLSPDSYMGTVRGIEATWDPTLVLQSYPTGAFYATQFGEIVSGPTDPRCSGTTTKYAVTYQNVCLAQYIATTMTRVGYPGNSAGKTYDATGVRVPN
jgi:hypothetical protein